MGRALIVLGAITILIGLVLTLGGRFGLGRLPGDIVVERKNFSFYFPVVTSIVVSIVLTVLLNLFLRKR
jgi:hypothetical protein